MKNHYQRTIGKLWERIEQQAALIASLRAEIDRLCAMLGEADSRLTEPKGGDA